MPQEKQPGRPRIHADNAARQKAYRYRRKRPVHFLSQSSEWSTPQEFFDALDREFGFSLDVCATAANAKCDRFYTKENDALDQDWHGTCWCNPPYGRGIQNWIRKAYDSSRSGATVVMLIPAHTDTRYWHELVHQASEIRFVKGRLKFSGASRAAPFPSVIIIFRPHGRDEGSPSKELQSEADRGHPSDGQ